MPVTLHQRSALAEQLGAAASGPGPVAVDAVEVDPMFNTTVPGLSAAGDVSSQMPSVANAVAAGSGAAAMIVHGLMTEAHGLKPVYLHSRVQMPREQILRSAAGAVAAGGTLLVVGHAGPPSWGEPRPDIDFPTPQEVLDELALPAGQWEVKRSDFVTRQLPDPDGEPATRPDNVLSVGRLGG